MQQTLQVIPLKTPQVGLTGSRHVLLEQLPNPNEVVLFPSVLGQVHVRDIIGPTQGLIKVGQLIALLFGVAFRLVGFAFLVLGCFLGDRRANRLPGAEDNSPHEGQGNERGSAQSRAVPPRKLAEPIDHGGGTRLHGLIRKVSLDIARQPVGRLVPPGAIFLQRFHRDPIQIPPKDSGEPLGGPLSAYQYDWNMLPVGQIMWLKHLETYKEFPPLQNPASYNLSEVLEQLKKAGHASD